MGQKFHPKLSGMSKCNTRLEVPHKSLFTLLSYSNLIYSVRKTEFMSISILMPPTTTKVLISNGQLPVDRALLTARTLECSTIKISESVHISLIKIVGGSWKAQMNMI